MTILTRCCCCCQLRTGVMILSWLLLVFVMFELVFPATLYDNRTLLFQDMPYQFGLKAVSLGVPFWIAAVVLKMICIVCLATGAWTGNRFLLLPWLVMEMIAILIYGLLVLISGGIVMGYSGGIGILIWIFGGLAVGYWFYIWLCVLSCFQELRDSGNRALLDYPPYMGSFLGTVQEATSVPLDV